MTKRVLEPLTPIGKYTDEAGVLRWCDDHEPVKLGNCFTQAWDGKPVDFSKLYESERQKLSASKRIADAKAEGKVFVNGARVNGLKDDWNTVKRGQNIGR